MLILQNLKKIMLSAILTRNMDIIFLVYGLSFIIMAIAILVQPRRESAFKISEIFWLLAAFGISHGINELLDMIQIIKRYDVNVWNTTRASILALSFIFLFEFGRGLLSLSLKKFFNRSLTIVVALSVFLLMFIHQSDSSIWPRYFLGFPGGLMAGAGFIIYYKRNKSALKLFKIRGYFVRAAVATALYGALAGLIVPKAAFFPASVINNASFLSITGIPVQVFRTFCAIVLSVSVFKILGIFHWEIISDLKISLQQVTASKFLVDNIIKSITDILIVVDFNGRIKLANEGACDILGYKIEELLNKPAAELFHGESLFSGKTLSIIKKESFIKNIELTCLHKVSKEISVLFSASLIKDQRGDLIGIVATGKDLTQIKKLQTNLTLNEKLVAMGKVANAIGHEFKNQLGVMRNSIYYLQLKLQNPDEKVKKHLAFLEQQVIETNMIIENMLSFAVNKRLDIAPLKLSEIISSSLDKIPEKEGIVLETQIADPASEIMADKIQISRVFVNIIINALDAMDNQGKLTITTGTEGQYVTIAFQDTGPGIKIGNMENIFEPFFSTKSGGMGLGLVTSKSIIEHHGGQIEITCQPDKGTKVLVKLPINSESQIKG